jgi:hypothetical protein
MNIQYAVSYQAQTIEEFRSLVEQFPNVIPRVSTPRGGEELSPSISLPEENYYEEEFKETYGNTRLTPGVIAEYGLDPASRENAFKRLKELLDTKQVIRGLTGGFKWVTQPNQGEALVSIGGLEGIDPDQCV